MTRKEYNQTVDCYADGLFRFLLKNTRDEEIAKDLVQDVFTKLWEKHESVDFTKAKSYLFTSGYRTMIDLFRKNKFVGEYSESLENSFSHNQQYTDLDEILDKALKILPEVQRSAILLRDYEGYSYKEIGEILTLKESQVKVYILRGRRSLQKYLKSVETVL